MLTESEIHDVLKKYQDTVFTKDVEGHLELYDSNVTLFDM